MLVLMELSSKEHERLPCLMEWATLDCLPRWFLF